MRTLYLIFLTLKAYFSLVKGEGEGDWTQPQELQHKSPKTGPLSVAASYGLNIWKSNFTVIPKTLHKHFLGKIAKNGHFIHTNIILFILFSSGYLLINQCIVQCANSETKHCTCLCFKAGHSKKEKHYGTHPYIPYKQNKVTPYFVSHN